MGDDRDMKAAEWLSRLRTRSVGNADLAEFASWRRVPGNAEAYRRAERLWEDAQPLGSDPDVRAAIASVLRRGRSGRTPLFARFGVAFAVVALLALGVMLIDRRHDDLRYRTAVGERSSAELADGSRMHVDADSEVGVRVDASGNGERRIVVRRGQALFAVRHDPARPFVVEAPSGVTVTALGTRFDVRVFPNGDVGVALLEGRVAVARSGETLATMTAGESLLVTSAGRVERGLQSARDAVDWTSGRLVFRGTTLRAAVAEMNRYSASPIVVARGDGAETISGEFSIDDPGGFAGAVNALLGAGTVERPSGT